MMLNQMGRIEDALILAAIDVHSSHLIIESYTNMPIFDGQPDLPTHTYPCLNSMSSSQIARQTYQSN